MGSSVVECLSDSSVNTVVNAGHDSPVPNWLSVDAFSEYALRTLSWCFNAQRQAVSLLSLGTKQQAVQSYRNKRQPKTNEESCNE
jgi:hypothetical protein